MSLQVVRSAPSSPVGAGRRVRASRDGQLLPQRAAQLLRAFPRGGACEGGLCDASRSARASRRDVRPPSGIATQPQALGQPVDPAHRLRTRRDGRSEEEARPVPRPRGAAAAGLRARALRVRFRLERAVPVRRMPAARQRGPHRRERGRPGGGYRLQGVAQWRLRAGFGIARRAGGRRGASPQGADAHVRPGGAQGPGARRGGCAVRVVRPRPARLGRLRPYGRGRAGRAGHRRRALRRAGTGRRGAGRLVVRRAGGRGGGSHRPGRAHAGRRLHRSRSARGDPCGYCPVLACEKRMGA